MIKSLKQLKTYNVGLEMTPAPFEDDNNPADITFKKPKITNNKVKITKVCEKK